MTRLILALLAYLGLTLIGLPAFAQGCSVLTYDHNGSAMQVEQCGRTLRIFYAVPRNGLAEIGVVPGTLLFDGSISRSGGVNGDARLFSAKCGEITYGVAGAIRSSSILLSGSAPKRNSNCRVTSYRNDELLFTLMTSTPQPTATASDWYAIIGSYRDRGDATAQAARFNTRTNQDWFVLNTRDCPNFTNGYWIATVGPLSKADATAWKDWSGVPDAYVKTCN